MPLFFQTSSLPLAGAMELRMTVLPACPADIPPSLKQGSGEGGFDRTHVPPNAFLILSLPGVSTAGPWHCHSLLCWG